MADAPKPKRRGGCFTRVVIFFLLIVLTALGCGVYSVFQPQSLEDIATRDEAGGNLRNLDAALRESLERGFPTTITEGQLNAWIAHRLAAKQGGMLSSVATLDGVRIRLEDGRAEIVTLRTVLGHPLTVSLYVQVRQTEGAQGLKKEVLLQGGAYDPDFPKLLRGGRFGTLVVPQGFLVLVLPGYQKLAAVFTDEIENALQEMSVIEIQKDRLVLNPLAKDAPALNVPGTF